MFYHISLKTVITTDLILFCEWTFKFLHRIFKHNKEGKKFI